jgi:integrase
LTEIEVAETPLPVLAPSGSGRARSPYWMYLARLDSDETRRTMQGCLDRMAAMLMPTDSPQAGYGGEVPWWQLRYEHAVTLRRVLLSSVGKDGVKWSPSHVNKHLTALRQVIRESWRLGYLTADERDRISDFENVKAKRLPAGRSIRPDETEKMLAACVRTGGALGTRDAAVIAGLHSTGGRRAELAGMLIEKYDHGERSGTLTGKGNKERAGYLHPVAAEYVDAWLALVGQRHGPIFRAVDKWGNISSRPLTPRAVGKIVDRRRRECKLPLLSTHDYRRTFIGDMLDAGVDLLTVQQLVGHVNPGTTSLYDRRPGRKRRAAVDKLTLPSPSALAAALDAEQEASE